MVANTLNKGLEFTIGPPPKCHVFLYTIAQCVSYFSSLGFGLGCAPNNFLRVVENLRKELERIVFTIDISLIYYFRSRVHYTGFLRNRSAGL